MRKAKDLRTREILNKFKPCLCKLYTVRQDKLQGSEELKGSLPVQQQLERVPSHLYTWHSHLSLYLAAVEKGRQEENQKERSLLFPTIK
jgi:hypothetical protein